MSPASFESLSLGPITAGLVASATMQLVVADNWQAVIGRDQFEGGVQ